KICFSRGCARQVEMHDAVAIRCDPVHAFACFQDIVDRRPGKSILGAVVRKLIAVKAAQAVSRAEPEKAVRVLHNALDAVVRRAGLSVVGLNRELFSARVASQSQHRYQNSEATSSTPSYWSS